MPSKKTSVKNITFSSGNFVYLLHGLLFGFFAFLLTFWLVLQPPKAGVFVFCLYAVQAIFTYSALFSIFLFVMEVLYARLKVKKDNFQQGVTTILFAVMNVFLTGLLLFLVYTNFAEKIVQLELQTQLRREVRPIIVKDYQQFNETTFGVWFKLASGIEAELSDIKPYSFYSSNEFRTKRVGPISFFTHNCFDGMDMSNTRAVKLLFGQEIQSPFIFILEFAYPKGYSTINRLKYFQKFDSITLTGSDEYSRCPKISINDFDNRSHAFGPARIDVDFIEGTSLIQYQDKENWYLDVVEHQSLKSKVTYQAKIGDIQVFSNKGNGNLFLFNGGEKKLTFINLYDGQVLDYQIPANSDFSPIGVIGNSNYFSAFMNGRPAMIGQRFSRSRETMILDRL